MCVLYVSFGSKVWPKSFGCVAMGSIFQIALIFCMVWSKQFFFLDLV